jgi:hypothetical protein
VRAPYDPGMRALVALLALGVIGQGCGRSSALAPGAPVAAAPLAATPQQRAVAAEERTLIEHQVRAHLELPADAALGRAEFARVTELNLMYRPITDAGVAWLSDPATGLVALTSLSLFDTEVTDAGVKDLARADGGLGALETLDLGSTRVTDAGLIELARADTGLRGLATLHLRDADVTEAGLAAVRNRWTNIEITGR